MVARTSAASPVLMGAGSLDQVCTLRRGEGRDWFRGRFARDCGASPIGMPGVAGGPRGAGMGGDALADPHEDLRSRPHSRPGVAAGLRPCRGDRGGPVTVMTFRSPGPEIDALGSAGHPFFRPRWGPMSSVWCSTLTSTGLRSRNSSSRATACWRRESWWSWSTDPPTDNEPIQASQKARQG